MFDAAESNNVRTIVLNLRLNARIDDGTAAWGQTDEESMTVDELAKRFGMPNVVFIDIEGAEYLALGGPYDVLNNNVDFLSKFM